MSINTALRHQLPPDFLNRLATIMPDEAYSQCLEAFNQDGTTVFRINTLKVEEQPLVDYLKNQGFSLYVPPWNEGAFVIPDNQRRQLLNTEAFKAGHIYLQHLSHQLSPMLLAPEPGEEVLDLAAAPGTQAIQMAAMMQNQGRITAVEIVKSRFFKLKENINQYGAFIVRPSFKDGGKIWKYCRNRFDRVLLNAPSTSESAFKTFIPDTYKHWSVNKTADMQAKQRRLLFSAIQCLKPGGTLIYSTATFSPDENELVVNRILEKFSDTISIESVDLPLENQLHGLTHWQGCDLNPELKKTIRIIPNECMDGHFICKIKKNIC